MRLTAVSCPVVTAVWQLLTVTRLKLGRCPRFLAATLRLYLDHSHCLVLAPATLAALPSTRAIPDRDVFYLGNPFPRFLDS